MDSITVYALRFDSGQTYVGLTKDLNRRLQEHRRRQSPSTRRFHGSFQLIYTKAFPTYPEARSHETYLKSGPGRQFLKSARA